MTAITPSLGREDLRTLALSALGGTLEFYDFVVFVFFTGVIGTLFFPPETPEWLRQVQTFGLFAVGYLARPLGGIIMAHFGDRGGRKRMFLLSVFMMAVPTLLIGLMPTYETLGYAAPLALLLMRVLQGAAVGGEAPGAWTFVAEHVPSGRVGFACGVLTGGLTAGILLGSVVAMIVNRTLSAEEILAWGWRIPFLLGGVFGLLAVYLRRLLSETPVFLELRRRRALAEGLPLRLVLTGHARAVGVSMLLTWFLTSGVVVVVLMTPSLLQSIYGLAAAATLEANVLATLTLSLGCMVFGWAADRWGAAPVLRVGILMVMATSYLLHLGVADAPELLDPLYALAGFAVGAAGVVPLVMVRAFPAAIRFSGVSFAYNVAYAIFGGLTPFAVALVVRYDALAPAHYVAAVGVIGIATTLFSEVRLSTDASVPLAQQAAS